MWEEKMKNRDDCTVCWINGFYFISVIGAKMCAGPYSCVSQCALCRCDAVCRTVAVRLAVNMRWHLCCPARWWWRCLDNLYISKWRQFNLLFLPVCDCDVTHLLFICHGPCQSCNSHCTGGLCLSDVQYVIILIVFIVNCEEMKRDQ